MRGQYFAGTVNGENRSGYRQEDKVNPESNVETYVALKLFIDNWRWSGVPFYLRTGKNFLRAPARCECSFVPRPMCCLPRRNLDLLPNALTLRLQPDEGISLRFNGKVPGNISARPVRMHFG